MKKKKQQPGTLLGTKTHLFFWYAVVFSLPALSAAHILFFGGKAESVEVSLVFLSVFVYFSGERGRHLLAAAAAGVLTLFLPRILVLLWAAL